MPKLTVDLLCKCTSSSVKKKKDETQEQFLARLTHVYCFEKNVDDMVKKTHTLYNNKLCHHYHKGHKHKLSGRAFLTWLVFFSRVLYHTVAVPQSYTCMITRSGRSGASRSSRTWPTSTSKTTSSKRWATCAVWASWQNCKHSQNLHQLASQWS